MVIGCSDVDAVRRKIVVGGSTLSDNENSLVCFPGSPAAVQHERTSAATRGQHTTHRNMAPFSFSYRIDTRDGDCRPKICD
jgi:hypothetical protein